jgi:hypothetical protein
MPAGLHQRFVATGQTALLFHRRAERWPFLAFRDQQQISACVCVVYRVCVCHRVSQEDVATVELSQIADTNIVEGSQTEWEQLKIG